MSDVGDPGDVGVAGNIRNEGDERDEGAMSDDFTEDERAERATEFQDDSLRFRNENERRHESERQETERQNAAERKREAKRPTGLNSDEDDGEDDDDWESGEWDGEESSSDDGQPAATSDEGVIFIIKQIMRLRKPTVVAISGAVGVGKTTYAQHLAAQFPPESVSIVSTDGFLLPNAVLESQGSLERKGHPDTFDIDALSWFLETIRTDESIIGLPRYSHDTFDVEPSDEPFTVTALVIIEGVNALQPLVAEAADLRIYIDADHADIVDWYVRRFEEFTAKARATDEGFYTRFASLSTEALRDMARHVYTSINLPNLVEHIEPTRIRADVVVHKAADHSRSSTLA